LIKMDFNFAAGILLILVAVSVRFWFFKFVSLCRQFSSCSSEVFPFGRNNWHRLHLKIHKIIFQYFLNRKRCFENRLFEFS
jgi:hypothetical protein